jgi:metal-dependent amidase/aminoacylase/carboxypeptidase family protein
MAAADHLTIDIEGVGGHAARPHLSIDTVLVGAQIINQLQSIVSRNVDPLQSAVVSICMFHAGNADNVIPQTASSTARAQPHACRPGSPERRVREVVDGSCPPARCQGDRRLPAQLSGAANHERQTDFAASVAGQCVGENKVDTAVAPVMGAEDFSFMLEARPGAFIFVGNGDSAGSTIRLQLQRRGDPIGTSIGSAGRERAAGVSRSKLDFLRLDLDDEVVALPQPGDGILANLGADPGHGAPGGVDVRHLPIGIRSRRLTHVTALMELQARQLRSWLRTVALELGRGLAGFWP